MAIKDQCSRCTLYNNLTDTCTKSYGTPAYDGHSCENYSRIGGNINLSKGGSINLDKPQDSSYTRTNVPAPAPAPAPAPRPTQQPVTQPSGGNQGAAAGTTQKQKMFSHPFSFNGRIRRTEFCLSYIVYFVWYFIYTALLETESTFMLILCLVSLIPAFWFFLAQGTKRCHDRDNSGFYILIPFYLLWMMFAEGDHGSNSYGPDPKA